MKPHLSVIAPSYNEKGIAVKTLENLFLIAEKSLPSYEIIVLDDHSTDGNLQELQTFAKGKPQIRILSHAKNQGTAISLRDLYANTQASWVITFSLDGEWDPQDVVRLYTYATKHTVDMVVGVRSHKYYTSGRQLVSFLFNLLPILFFGVKTHDAGSMKATKRELIQNTPIISKGVFNEAERVIRAKKAGSPVGTIHINHLPTKKKKRAIPRFDLITQAVHDMISVWYALQVP